MFSFRIGAFYLSFPPPCHRFIIVVIRLWSELWTWMGRLSEFRQNSEFEPCNESIDIDDSTAATVHCAWFPTQFRPRINFRTAAYRFPHFSEYPVSPISKKKKKLCDPWRRLWSFHECYSIITIILNNNYNIK